MAVYKPRLALWQHQRKGVRLMSGKRAFALFMGMRTGKSATLITDWGQLCVNHECRDMLIFAPAGVYKTWPMQFEEHCMPRLFSELSIYVWEASRTSMRESRLLSQFLDKSGPRIMLINVEAASTVDRARDAALAFLRKRPAMTAIDESTVIKGPESERTEFMIKAVRPLSKYRRILSGLPSPNGPFDLWSQMYFLDPSILGDSFQAYKRKYAEIEDVCMLPRPILEQRLRSYAGNNISIPGFGKVSIKDMPRQMIMEELDRRGIWYRKVSKVKTYRHEDELNKLIKPHSYRVRLSECYDMPDKVYGLRHVDMTKEQARIYKDLKELAFAELSEEEFVTGSMVLTRMLRLHQVLCGQVPSESGVLHHIPENRSKQLLEELAEYDGKAIIWCSYDHDVQKLTQLLRETYGDKSVARFWGGNRKTREDEEARFKNDDDCRFMLATPSAGGRGRTWNIADLMVYYSNTVNLEHRSQSEERGEKFGKSTPTAIVDLMVPGTVDEKFLHMLRNKITLSDRVMGDDWKKWVV